MELTFLLKTVAELQGAQAIANSLEQQIGKAKALGQDYAALQKQLDGVNATIKTSADSIANLSKEMGVVSVSGEEVQKILGKTGDKAELTHRQTRMLASAMGADIPGAAALMEAGFSLSEGAEARMMRSTFLLVAALEILKATFDKISEQRKEATHITEELNDVDQQHTHVIDAQREALDQAEVSEAEFNHNFIRNTQDAIARANELAGAIIKTVEATENARVSMNQGIADQHIEEMEQRGIISHATALKMKEQLDIQYEQAKLARQRAFDLVEQNQLQNQINNRGMKLIQDQDKLPDATAAATAAERARATNAAHIEDAKEKIAGGEETKKELRGTGVTEDNIQKLREIFQNLIGGNTSTTPLQDQFQQIADSKSPMAAWAQGQLLSMFGTSGAVNLANYEGANADITLGKHNLKAAQDASPGLDINAGNAQSDLAALRADMEKQKDQIADLQAHLADKKAVDNLTETNAKADFNSGRATKNLAQDLTVADAVTSGQQVNGLGPQAQQMLSDAAAIAGHGVDLATAAKIIENGANGVANFSSQVQRVADALGKVTTPAQTQQTEKAVKDLENRVKTLEDRKHPGGLG